MLDERFVYVALAISVAGAAGYLTDTWRGRTQPNRVTWGLWALVAGVAFAAQVGEGVGPQAWLTLASSVIPLLVFLVSFRNRDAYWSLSRLDVVCGVASLVGVVLWIITREGLLAYTLSLAADALAGVPTLVKAFRHPETESVNVWIAGVLSSGLTLLTLDEWSFAAGGFAAYLVLNGTLNTISILFRPGPRLVARRQRAASST